MSLIARFAKNESGATAIEYGLLAALVGVAIIGVVRTMGTTMQATYTRVATDLGNANKAK